MASFWSFDGSQVYFFRDGVWSIVNTDGSGKQPLKCELCAMAPDPISYAVAQSPDGRQIAIGYRDGMVVIASADLTSYKLAAVGGYVSRLRWSPDSLKLAVDLSPNSNQSDVVILGVDGTLLKQFNRPAGVNFINTCGWSPDSRQVDYLATLGSGSDLYLQALGQETPVRLVSFKNFNHGCPIWLP
jgi:Tol biopolymer transport system component